MAVDDWVAIAERNARPQNTFIGWVFFEPAANDRYAELGIKFGGYIAGRAAPLAPAGADAVVAAFYSISPAAIRAVHALVTEKADWGSVRAARDAAVMAGLQKYVPECLDYVAAMEETLWEAVDACPVEGKVMFGAYRSLPRPTDPVLSSWYAINCLREFRGDVHWALYTAAGIGGVEASVLHNAWLGYERDWLPKSRMSTPDEIAEAWSSLAERGLVRDGEVVLEGLELRERIEVRTNELAVAPWKAVGRSFSDHFVDVLREPCKVLGKTVDVNAGTNYGPGARSHEKGFGSARKKA